MTKEIKKDAWGRDIWVPSDYPFVVRSHRQSSQAGNFGWVVDTVGKPFATYEEAREVADRAMGRGEKSRSVHQALNPQDWSKSGKWHKCFERKRGNLVTEPGPIK